MSLEAEYVGGLGLTWSAEDANLYWTKMMIKKRSSLVINIDVGTISPWLETDMGPVADSRGARLTFTVEAKQRQIIRALKLQPRTEGYRRMVILALGS